MSADRLPLSVCIIAKDAASQIEACIASVPFADEVLVVEWGSADDTAARAAQLGARVLRQEWLGFGPQKQFAVDNAKHDWVLCLDVDERVTPELAKSITAAVKGDGFRAYRMPRRNRFLGRWLAYGEGYPDWSLRLFHRGTARWSSDPVHEAVIPSSAVGSLDGDLLHESAEDLATYVQKQNRYSTLHAEALYQQGTRASFAKLFFSPLARFIKFYFLRRGFLDGGPGFAHVVIGCFAAFAKYAKLMELSQRRSSEP